MNTKATTGPVPMSEAEFQKRVIDTAHAHHWLVQHSRKVLTEGRWQTPLGGDAGFPDLVLARAGVVLIVELKTDGGRLEPEQREWLIAMGGWGRVWRPKHWPRILEVLSAPPGTPCPPLSGVPNAAPAGAAAAGQAVALEGSVAAERQARGQAHRGRRRGRHRSGQGMPR